MTVLSSTQEIFPVSQERRHNLVGVVSVKDIRGQLVAGENVFPYREGFELPEGGGEY